ncbi:hypothetical protein Poli38472_003497 [Pythium oligandrum]|uniref:PIPK domain-containing protein n=1 Tax=Pythium oligandrum TaxID=41045 RepID=A0A8K1FFE1_PYTOL|nr:hypothetical protein Poli38472_003497 [Pythium oligandrum]|eukprot:TMW57572.1 hypothetical protein Poli38472_003497 [Pythium oligandrum]
MVDELFLAWQLTALGSCLLAGGSMLYFFCTFKRTRVHPGPALLCIFLSTCIANLTRVALQTIHRHDENEATNRTLRPVTLSDVANNELMGGVNDIEPYVPFFFWCEFFFLTSTTMWVLMLALDLIFSLSNPFLPFNADNLKHHFVAWPTALLYCILFRYVLGSTSHTKSRHILLFFHLPSYVVVLYISVALVVAWRKSRRLEYHAHLTTRRMAKLILPYLAVFATYTVVSFVIYLVHLSRGYESTTSNAIDQLALVLEALSIFVLFCRDAGVFKALSHKKLTGLPMHRSLSQTELGETHVDRLDVSNKLRRDIMRYTSMGIIQSIKMSIENPVEAHHEVAIGDYNRIESMAVIVHGEIDSTTLSFHDCAPKVFQSIRQHFNVDPHFLLQSFDLSKLLSEHGGEGKSGSIFYFTANKRFMVKSVPKTEYDTLRAILPHYHRYMLSSPQSMLCRYYGCYSITLPVGTRRMYFVVMQNLFHEGPVHQRFDLKGNFDRRQAINANDVEDYIQLARDQRVISTLMMDIDFRKLCGGMFLSPPMIKRVKEQLNDDIVFLASRGIIDYSILLGVRYLNSGERLPSLAGQGAGIYSQDMEKVYYLGTIDMLQRYNWRWTLQRWVLGLLCKDTQDVSAVPPQLYASRLEEFVGSRLFDIQGSSARGSIRSSNGRRGGGGGIGATKAADVDGPTGQAQVRHLAMDQFHPSAYLQDAPMSPTFSMESSGLYRHSSSSSPSVAYSSVCQSPISSRPSTSRATTEERPPSSASRAVPTSNTTSKPAFFI